MEETNYKLTGEISLALPRDQADKLLALADGTCALLYLFTLRNGGSFTTASAAKALCRTDNEILKAAELLRENGVFSPSATKKLPLPAEELPEYTVEEIVARTEKSPDFSAIIVEAQNILGKTLTGADMKTLFGIYDHLGLPPEVIVLLINHCLNFTRQRYGPGRLPTMRTIEKEAYIWHNNEIITLERAEVHLQKRLERSEIQGEIMQTLQIYGRKLAPTEQTYVDNWLDMGFGLEVIALAYDKTIVKTGKLSWGYINSILGSWHQKGLHTLEQVERGDSKPGAAPKNYSDSPGIDDDKMNKILNKIKNG